jgi:hypothetical protein
MYLNEEQIKEIEEMAELFFSLDEIATNAEIDSEDFRDAVQSKTGEAYSAYMRGWFKARSHSVNPSPRQQPMVPTRRNKCCSL